MAIKIKVELLLDVPDDGASPYDAINEILRGQQRSFAPESCLIDYAIYGGFDQIESVNLDLETYEEGEAFA